MAAPVSFSRWLADLVSLSRVGGDVVPVITPPYQPTGCVATLIHNAGIQLFGHGFAEKLSVTDAPVLMVQFLLLFIQDFDWPERSPCDESVGIFCRPSQRR